MHGIESRNFIDHQEESEFEKQIKTYLDYFG